MHLNKILLVGLDGATFDLIRPWAEAGKLPTLERILRDGAHAPLRSTMPPVTPLAWSSLITGANPGQHGIYGFVSRKPGTYDWYPTSAAMRRGISLWEWAGRHGRSAGVFNMPMTYPPEAISNGYMVSGMGVPDVDVRFAWPESLQNDLLQRFRPEQLVEQSVALFNGDTFVDYLLQSVADNLAVTHYLLERYPETNLLCAVITATDRVQHFYWRQMSDPSASEHQRTAIERIYRRVDDALAELIERYPDHTLIIMSDHGAGPYRHLVGMNQWLAREGWLHWLDAGGADGGKGPASRRAYYWFGRALPPGIRRQIKQWLPASLMSKVRSEMAHWTLPVDWARTRVYSAGFGGNLYLNLRGREPAGCVEPGAEADALLAEVEAALYGLRDPDTGEPVVEQVFRAEKLYHGQAVSDAPDLVVAWRAGYYSMAGMGSAGQNVFQGNLRWPGSDVMHTAEHRLHGILLAYGPGIAARSALPEASITDLAPTLTHLLGLPIPSAMEGRVLAEFLTPGEFGEPTVVAVSPQEVVAWQSAYSADEEVQMQSQLRALGYLD